MAARIIVTDQAYYAFTVPPGKMLSGWEMRGDAVQEIKVGWTAYGSEIAPPTPMLPGQSVAGAAISNSTSTQHVVYFTGMAGTNTIKLWLIG